MTDAATVPPDALGPLLAMAYQTDRRDAILCAMRAVLLGCPAAEAYAAVKKWDEMQSTAVQVIAS